MLMKIVTDQLVNHADTKVLETFQSVTMVEQIRKLLCLTVSFNRYGLELFQVFLELDFLKVDLARGKVD